MTAQGDPRLRKDDKEMNYEEVMKKLEALASHDLKDLAGMARFGINVDKAWVISIPKLRALAREVRTTVIPAKAGIQGKRRGTGSQIKSGMTKEKEELHELALRVWDSGIHEAQILAGFIDVPELVTEEQMERWVLDFDSWDVCDQVCAGLFDRTRFAVQKAREWSARSEEFVKRAGFVLMAGLAVHDKKMADATFVEFLEIIKREAGDERNFVRKAVNWALRTIGKSRNKHLYEKAMEVAREILDSSVISTEVEKSRSLGIARDDKKSLKAARWVANDTLRELQKDYIKKRFV